MFDLTATSFGWDPSDVLGDLRRGRHDILEVVSTLFADWLDTPGASGGFRRASPSARRTQTRDSSSAIAPAPANAAPMSTSKPPAR